ncbi:xanthine dehydrogenase family protein molybdopterin-binding subunit [Cognataquiflexum aquatile]|uniref:xanthine dehydrogenase family protein molybdopterin-binding subunit n=1 Tax=Cognataquiflexum aquatile TaxID=2249427 RepID=UPI000DEB7A92|nr:molybdopterin cofactor-binding domain-containing protein [Cognataquiflexum aquatile]
MEKQIESQGLSRRKFLKVGGGITFLVTAVGLPALVFKRGELAESKQISAWVHLSSDGTVTIYNPASEMGQGTMTALAAIFAEEMDADWSKVKIEDAPVEPDIYGIGWGGERGGSMLTVGSRSVSGHYNNLRQSGAQARYVLLSAVAEKWGVDRKELKTDSGVVFHPKSNKKITYGEIVEFVKIPESVPEIPDSDLKNPKDFKLIGRDYQRYDVPFKVDGSAIYSGDIHLPGMVYAAIVRSPVNGTQPELKNESSIRGIKGVLNLVSLKHGIGVVAGNMETALKAKAIMEITWNGDPKAKSHNSQDAYEEYEALSKSSKTGSIVAQSGDLNRELPKAQKTIRADYKNDYIYHAQMEPLNAVAHVKADSAEVWVGTQATDGTRNDVANHLGLDFKSVNLHTCYLGGGFGRRSMTDFVIEAVDISKAVNLPVKLQWTREDDLQYGAFRPISLQKLEAGIDQNGNINSWKHVVIGTGGGLLGSGADIPFYDIPNKLIEVRNIDHGVRTKHWRAVGHGPNKFAIETFVDEIALEQKKDPYQLRRELMKNHPRELAVLDKVADMAQWGSPVPEGRARGIAFAERSGSLAAGICEISVDRSTGKIKVHKIWGSLDGGVVVHPANAKYQMEGSLVMGLSSVLFESITFKEGQVEQSNFYDYPILRMEDAPEEIMLEIISSTEKPTGIGEAGLPFMGAIISNAFAALTGKRLRHMPFTPEKVLEVLSS